MRRVLRRLLNTKSTSPPPRHIDYLKTHQTYPFFRPSHQVSEFTSTYGEIENGSRIVDVSVRLAGRIAGKREAGKKLCFYDLRCENGEKVQVLAEKQYFDGDFRFENQNLRRGDVIGVVGFPYVYIALSPSYKKNNNNTKTEEKVTKENSV